MNQPEPNPEAIVEVTNALLNFMGLFDSPVERRRRGHDELFMETLQEGRKALKAAGVERD